MLVSLELSKWSFHCDEEWKAVTRGFFGADPSVFENGTKDPGNVLELLLPIFLLSKEWIDKFQIKLQLLSMIFLVLVFGNLGKAPLYRIFLYMIVPDTININVESARLLIIKYDISNCIGYHLYRCLFIP